MRNTISLLGLLAVALAGLLTFANENTVSVGRFAFASSPAASPPGFTSARTPQSPVVFNFDNDAPGRLPAHFQAARTGQGPEGAWIVREDPTAPSKPNVVAQTSEDKTDYRFPILVADSPSLRDLELRGKIKAVSGRVDRAAGLVFRLKDKDNYYIVRANALEDNFRLYHVFEGRRRQFAGANLKITSGEWHEIKVECVGNKFICYYDGVKKIEASDDTFKEAGKIGLWTKADSVTYFDDLTATPK
jgi:hypothetical protein